MIIKLLKDLNNKTSNSGFFGIRESSHEETLSLSFKRLTGIIKPMKRINSFNFYFNVAWLLREKRQPRFHRVVIYTLFSIDSCHFVHLK